MRRYKPVKSLQKTYSGMQQITPIEIRQKSFEKSFRGYNPDEVDAFLHALAYAWEKLIVQLDEAKSIAERNSREVGRLQGIEDALLKTIKDADVTAHHIIEQAKKEAELKAGVAKLETEQLMHEAQVKVQAFEVAHQAKHQHLQKRMEQDLVGIKKMVQEAEMYRDALLQQLQQLSEDILTRSRLIGGDIRHNSDKGLENKKPDMDSSSLPDASAQAAVAAV